MKRGSFCNAAGRCAMQIPQITPGEGPAKVGDYVRVRGTRWRVSDVRSYENCQLVTLTGIALPDAGVERRVLAPFDTIEPIDRPHRLHRVRAPRWRHAARALIAGSAPPGSLRTVLDARIDVMSHQLEPALAVLRGFGCRVLLADEVGLGKTIQAAILIAELRARGAADRVLILAPAGLREQWTAELSGRFGIDARIADAATLRRRAAEMPIGLNPWSRERVAVASTDYVKRPEVLPAVAADPWDVLIVDEAHTAAGDSDRHAAVSALASQAAVVLLMTATPHSGDRQSFASLTGLGAIDNEPLLVFRRTRSTVRAGARRRIHALHVQPTAAETDMHARLMKYTRALLTEDNDAWLPASVLHKRAFSSAWSLAQSVERRLDALARADPSPSASVEQLALPLGDRDGEQTRADEPPAWPADLGLADAGRETRLLRKLLAAAQLAARTESKLNAIRRILRRANEPAIVFTEYRDTLLRLQHALGRPATLLHGGLTREERTAVLHDFSQQRHTLLLATDAAGEGLNLHHTCRLVIDLELPWNPMRLEQRIGRVDRIGQQRVVHAFHLISAHTGEERILERLKDRIARARADIGSPDPFGGDEERAIARAITGCDETAGPWHRPAEAAAALIAATATPDLQSEANVEARRLTFARLLYRDERRAAPCGEFDLLERVRLLIDNDGTWVCRTRRSSTRASLGHRILLLWQLGFEDGCGRIAESACVWTAIRVAALPRVRHCAWLEDVLRAIDLDVHTSIDHAAAPWRESVERITHAFASARLRREHAIEATCATAPPDVFQPGLFDRRAQRQHLDALREHQRADRDRASRLQRVASTLTLRPALPRLLLVMVP